MIVLWTRLLVPLASLYLIKLSAWLVRALPCFKTTRKEALRLQRVAALRKQEVRRMTDGGQQFVVRKTAKTQDVKMDAAAVTDKLQTILATKASCFDGASSNRASTPPFANSKFGKMAGGKQGSVEEINDKDDDFKDLSPAPRHQRQ